MNREIKFKGVSVSDNKTLVGYYMRDNYSHAEYISEFVGIESGESIFDWVAVHPGSVGQFTGLHDKAGKEVFEGDFVRLHEYGDVYKEIVFHKGSFCVHGFNFWPEKSEIIGNKYQNPELV